MGSVPVKLLYETSGESNIFKVKRLSTTNVSTSKTRFLYHCTPLTKLLISYDQLYVMRVSLDPLIQRQILVVSLAGISSGWGVQRGWGGDTKGSSERVHNALHIALSALRRYGPPHRSASPRPHRPQVWSWRDMPRNATTIFSDWITSKVVCGERGWS